jgi:hypothetical protein
MALSRPPRLSSSIIVWVLSAVVLGTAWAVLLLNYPKQEDGSVVTHSQPLPSPPPAQTSSADHLSPPPPTAPGIVLPSMLEKLRVRQQEEEELKCEAQLENLCPYTLLGDDRRRCIQDNEPKFPPSCQGLIQRRLAHMKESLQHLKVACEADARRFCRTVQGGGGRILQCLEDHAQEISDGCFQALPKRSVVNLGTPNQ